MRKFLLMCGMALFGISGASAQSEDFYGVGKRIGVGVGVGLEGIGIDASVSLTKWCSARIGLNIMPSVLKISEEFAGDELGTVTIPYSVDQYGNELTKDYSLTTPIEAEASFSRTQVELKFDLYPFPNASSFFLCAGFSFGGNKLVKIKGHNDDARDIINNINDDLQKYKGMGYSDLDTKEQFGIEIDQYKIPINEDGNVTGGLKVSGFRPYLGLGFGRAIPKNRIGFRFEIGASFQGKPKVYADGVDLDKILDDETENDISDFMNYLKVYPVLKFSLRGRIL